MKRRDFVVAGAAALAASGIAAPSLGAERASRTFRILRDGDDIGTHALEAVQGASGFEVAVTIRIAVKVLGITAYRYEMDNREVWSGGKIVSVESRVNDDGTDDRCTVRRSGERLTVTGSRFSGETSGDAATTSYFAQPFLQRQPWISTQSGAPLDLAIGAVPGRAGWFDVRGGLNTVLGYDDRGEWTGCEFDAGGELARYEIISQSGQIGALWSSV